MDQLDQDAQRLLSRVRAAREPKADDKARMDALLAASLGLAAGTSAVTAAASLPKGAATGLGLKAALVSTLLALAGFGGYFGWQAGRESAQPPAAGVVASSPAPAAPSIPEDQAVAAAAGAVAAAQEPATADAPTPEQQPTAAPPKRVAPKATLPEELDLLHEAQLRWRSGDAAEALKLLRRHQQRFPRSQLASERNALTALSLCTLGRYTQGRKQARRIIAQEPRSPLRASLEETCLR
jgi:hypothetical protein